MSGSPLRGAQMLRGVQRFQGGVISTAWRLAHRKVGGSRAPRIELPFFRKRESESRREHTKGPCSRKTSRFASSVSFSRGGVDGELGCLHGSRRTAPLGWCGMARAKVLPASARRKTCDGGVRGSIALSPWEDNSHASRVSSFSPEPSRIYAPTRSTEAFIVA